MRRPRTTVRQRSAHVTVIGKDKSGVIARMCQFVFDCDGNIEELDQHVTRGLFTMHIEVSWPSTGHTMARMERGMREIGADLGMDIEFRASRQPDAGVRIGLLVTKESHAPKAVLAACKDGTVSGTVVVMLGNHPDLQALAKQHGIPFHHVADANKAEHENAMLEYLRDADVDLVVLARYMRILSPNFVWRFPHRIINIHPSLLPAFPGAVPYRQALERGVRVAGVTAHLVTVDLDQGPIVAQEAFSIAPDASLATVIATGQAHESKVLVAGIRQWCEGLEVGWGRTWPRPEDS